MNNKNLLAAALIAAIPFAASAQDATSNWTGTGEFGLAMARGNARSDNANGKLSFANEDGKWKHAFYIAALRNEGEVTGDFDGDGVVEDKMQLSANRYEIGASSALKMDEKNSWIAALRYENDDFAPYDYQATFSLGYGRTWIDTAATTLTTDIGPGYRRAKDTITGETIDGLIARGALAWTHKLSETASLYDNLLVESGSDNTFASNDFGISVAISEAFALKAGLEARHNTDVAPGIKSTDTLTKVNLVYSFK